MRPLLSLISPSSSSSGAQQGPCKRKKAIASTVTKRSSAPRTNLPRLYHYFAEKQGERCYLTLILSTNANDAYNWTCEDCRAKCASGDAVLRHHCTTHCVDVCLECYHARINIDDLEVVPLHEEEVEEEEEEQEVEEEEKGQEDQDQGHGAHRLVEVEAEEDSDEDEDEEKEEEEVEDDDDDEQEEEEEEEADRCDGELDPVIAAALKKAREQALADRQKIKEENELAIKEVRQMLVYTWPLSEEKQRRRLKELWSTYPQSVIETISLVTSSCNMEGYDRVLIEEDDALLHQLLAAVTIAHVRELVKGVEELAKENRHQLLMGTFIQRICEVAPECSFALQRAWYLVKTRTRQDVNEDLLQGVKSQGMSLEAFIAGPLLHYQQTYPQLHFTPIYFQDELMYAATEDGHASALQKVEAIWSAYPFSGVACALRAMERWTALTHKSEWNRYGQLLVSLLENHVTEVHVDLLIRTSTAAIKPPQVFPLLAPLHACLSRLAAPDVVAAFAPMTEVGQVEEAQLRASIEADAQADREEADQEDVPTQEDLDFIVEEDDEEENQEHTISEVVRLFAEVSVQQAPDSEARLAANVIYTHFTAWFQQRYPDEPRVPSRKLFGQEFQLLYPDKERRRLVEYLGIMLR